ncbi:MULTISPECIES: hypothetical protein [unclassified Shewanella]|jgi:hypothetical protein|nr:MULTISPECIES: hypothetical protein [unclassified Shewanella]
MPHILAYSNSIPPSKEETLRTELTELSFNIEIMEQTIHSQFK